MPRAAKNPTIDPSQVYVCWMSGSAEVDGQNVSFVAGERLRGDSPAVQGCPQYFVADGTPESERPNAFKAITDRAEADRPPVPEHDAVVRTKPDPIELPDVRVLTRDIKVLVGVGQVRELARFDKGAVFHAGCELVAELPNAFEAADPKLTRRGK